MVTSCQLKVLAVLAAANLGFGPVTGWGATAPPTALAGPADSSLSTAPPGSFQGDVARLNGTERIGIIEKTTDLIGKKVEDRNWVTVGKVEDFVLDLANGRLIVALVSGSDSQVTPVPAGSFRAADKDRIFLKVDHETFKNAPRLAKPISLAALNAESLSGTFRYFHQTMPELAGTAGLVSAANLAGEPLMSQDNHPLGQLDTLMVDVPGGRLVYLVIKPGGGSDAQRDRYVVPPSAIKGQAGSTLVLKADQAHFVAGPHFQTDFWADTSRPELAAAVREHYSTDQGPADPTRQPVRARVETPSSASTLAMSDQEITAAVERQMMSDLAVNASASDRKGIKIKAAHGRVTLAGQLKNEKERKTAIAAAERVVGAGKVDDEMEPRPK